jgi:hypothetical protein
MRTDFPSFAPPVLRVNSAERMPVGQRLRVTPPFVQLAAARAQTRLRITLPPVRQEELARSNRALLKAMRAAELATWQTTGGDAWIRSRSLS